MKIGWIGCGNMGSPMVMNLIKAGYSLIVNDVSPDNVKPLLANGAVFAHTPKEIAVQSDFIFTMVPNGRILNIVNLHTETGLVNGLSPGKTVVDMSTVSPAESMAVCGKITDMKCDFLRAPVTGSTSLAASASLGILASGKKSVYDKVLPLLKKLGNNYFYLGEDEQARVLKLALNIMIAINLQMLAEALVLIDKSGLDRALAMDIIGKSAVGAPVINYKTDNVVNSDYTAAFSVAMMEKDLDLALSAAKDYNVGLPVTALTRQFLAIADATGNAHKDFSYLVELLGSLSK